MTNNTAVTEAARIMTGLSDRRAAILKRLTDTSAIRAGSIATRGEDPYTEARAILKGSAIDTTSRYCPPIRILNADQQPEKLTVNWRMKDEAAEYRRSMVTEFIGLDSALEPYYVWQARPQSHIWTEEWKAAHGAPKGVKALQSKSDRETSHIVLTKAMYEKFIRIVENGDALHLLITEGTRQTTVASILLTEEPGYIVVGIFGCSNWATDGIPHDGLRQLMDLADRITVAIDDDVRSNPAVWDATEGLKTLAEGTGTKAKFILHAANGPASKAGLDDRLGAVTIAAERKAVLLGWIAAAKFGIGQKPKAKKKDTVVTMEFEVIADPENPRVAERRVNAVRNKQGEVVHEDSDERPVAFFAPRIMHATSTHDDLSNSDFETTYDLEVTVEGGRTYKIENLPDSEVGDARAIAARDPYGEAPRTNIPLARADREAFEKAVRMTLHPAFQSVVQVRRVGLVRTREGLVGWVTPTGTLTADGLDPNFRSAVSNDLEHFTLVDPDSFTEDERAEAVRVTFVDAPALLKDPTPWYLMLALHLSTVAGMRPHGSLVIIGKGGSGKTHLARSCSSVYGPMFHPEGSAYAGLSLTNKTAGVIAEAGSGMHNATAHVDDFSPKEDPSESSAQSKAFDSLMRRGYDGSAASKERLTGTSYKKHKVDSSAPTFIATMETFETVSVAASAHERYIGIDVSHESTFATREAARQFDKWAREGVFNLAMSMWIKHLVALDDNGNDFTSAVEVEARREAVQFRMNGFMETTDERAAQVAASIITGLIWALEVFELGALEDHVLTMVGAAQDEHWARIPATVSNGDDVIEAVVSKLRFDAVLMNAEHPGRESGKAAIGWWGLTIKASDSRDGVDHENVVVLDPAAVADLLWNDATKGRKVTTAFRKHSLTSGPNGFRKTVNGNKIKGIAVPAVLLDYPSK